MARVHAGPQALLVTALALPIGASAVVLDFDESTSLSTQGYGDIPGLLDVSHAYQNGATVNPLSWWGAGYDDLVGVAWGPQQAAGTIGRLTLAALDASQAVRLGSFQIGSWESSGVGRIETVTVTRIGEATPAFSFTGVIGADNRANTFAPGITSASGVVIEWTNPWWTAIDNVSTGFAAAVPEPGTALLMPLGLLTGLMWWRRRADMGVGRSCQRPSP
jgi:hypothetical protein